MNYLIWSNKHHAWWGPDRAGYYSLKNAGLYTEMEAMTICGTIPGGYREYLDDGRPVSIMIPAPNMDIVRAAATIEKILVLAVGGQNALEWKEQ